MTPAITHVLTKTEISAGVTLEQVADLLPKALIRSDGPMVILPAGTSPALASSTARCALAGPVEFAGFNQLAQPVYRREEGDDA